MRRRLKSTSVSAESSVKLQNAEARLTELKSSTVALGKEATAAMLSVEDQQQQMTFHKLRTMVLLLIVCEDCTWLFYYILVAIDGYKVDCCLYERLIKVVLFCLFPEDFM